MFKLIHSNIRIDFNGHKQTTNVITALYLRGFSFRTGATNVTVLVGYDELSLGNWFITSYSSIFEDAMTVLSLDVGNKVITDAASCLSNVTRLFFIDYSTYKERLQTV
jgi:hypothetical protein